MRGYKTMYDYRGKVAGMIVAGMGFILMVIQRITHLAPIKKFNGEQTFNCLLWLTLAGLFTMMFSYEKNEDERVKQIRSKSFMIAFMILVSPLLAFALVMSLRPAALLDDPHNFIFTPDDIIMAGRMLMFYPAVSILLYLIIFHIGVYYDRLWDYNDNIGIIENLKRNKWMILGISIASTILVYLVFMFLI